MVFIPCGIELHTNESEGGVGVHCSHIDRRIYANNHTPIDLLAELCARKWPIDHRFHSMHRNKIAIFDWNLQVMSSIPCYVKWRHGTAIAENETIFLFGLSLLVLLTLSITTGWLTITSYVSMMSFYKIVLQLRNYNRSMRLICWKLSAETRANAKNIVAKNERSLCRFFYSLLYCWPSTYTT